MADLVWQQGHAVVLEVYEILRRLDLDEPPQAPDPPFHDRLVSLQCEIDALLQQTTAAADERWLQLKTRLQDIRNILQLELENNTDFGRNWTRRIALRQQLQPIYIALASSLRSCHMEVPSLRPENATRSGVHLLSGCIGIVVVALLDMTTVQFITTIWFAAAWLMELGRSQSQRINRLLMKLLGPIAHPHEHHRVNSATWYCTALLLLSLSESPIVCFTGLVALGLGDPCASWVGRRWGKHRLAHGRSAEGTMAFIVASTFGMVLTLFWWVPTWPATSIWVIALVSSTASGILELLTQTVDDNLVVPITAGCATWFVCTALQLPI